MVECANMENAIGNLNRASHNVVTKVKFSFSSFVPHFPISLIFINNGSAGLSLPRFSISQSQKVAPA